MSHSSAHQLRAGSGRVVITPPVGCPLGGNARIDNYASGVMADLHVRCLYLQNEDRSLCLISLEVLSLWQNDATRIRQRVAEALSLPVDYIMLACTHTHSGPDTTNSLVWNDDKLARDTALLATFWESLPEKIVQACRAAKDSAQPSVMRYGRIDNREIAHNRRLKMKSGQTKMNWELPPAEDVDAPLGPIDPQVTAVIFQDTGGKTLGGFIHYACHPAILAGINNSYSGDYAGAAVSQLESDLKCQAILYLYGAAGNVNHIDYRAPGRDRGQSEVMRCAALLTESVYRALQFGRDENASELSITQTELLFPFRDIPPGLLQTAEEILARYQGTDISMPDGVPPEVNARKLLKMEQCRQTGHYAGRFAELREGKIVVPLQHIRIGPISLGAVPAEMFVEYGLQFKNQTGNPFALIVGLANGLVGYVPTPAAFAEGGYESGYGPSYLPEGAGNQIVDSLGQMVLQ